MAGVLALTVGLASCSATGGRKAVEDAQRQMGSAGTPEMTVAMITHSAPGDTFWDIVRKGAQDAAKKDNVRLQYTASPEGSQQANLVQQAIDKKVDGIAVTMAKPDALAPVLKKAKRAGIPVTVVNGGLDEWRSVGALSYYGQDERIAGQQAGDRLKREGAKKPLCVIHEQGNVGHESRCAGVKDRVPGTKVLYVNGKTPSDVQTKITAALQQDKSIDDVVTLGGPFAMIAVKAKQQTGSSAKVVTFDTSDDVLSAIKGKQIAWAVDQQPYLQGYLSVDQLWLYKTNGNVIGGGKPVLTGPTFVDAGNAADVQKYAKSGRR